MRQPFSIKWIHLIERRSFDQKYKFSNKNDMVSAWRNFQKKSCGISHTGRVFQSKHLYFNLLWRIEICKLDLVGNAKGIFLISKILELYIQQPIYLLNYGFCKLWVYEVWNSLSVYLYRHQNMGSSLHAVTYMRTNNSNYIVCYMYSLKIGILPFKTH